MTPAKKSGDLEFVQPVHEGAGPVGLVEMAPGQEILQMAGEESVEVPERLCNVPGCTNIIPADAHFNTKKCSEHFVGAKRGGAKTQDKPPKVTVNLPGPKRATNKDQAVQDVAAGAEAMLGFIPLGLAMFGDAECAGIWKNQLPLICQQIGEVSKYHPKIGKLFASTSNSGEAGAWFGLLMATSPAVVMMMAHHGMLPASVGAALAGAVVSGSTE